MINNGVTLLREPGIANDVNQRRLYDGDRFIRELGQWLGVPACEVHGSLESAPSEGYVLLEADDPVESLRRCGEPLRGSLAARVVAMDVDRQRLLEDLLEPRSVIAAIDTLSLIEWSVTSPETVGAWGMCGRIDVGARIGARPSGILMATAHHGLLVSPQHHGLPHLLADYLRALAGDATSPSP